jgi:hypothetical protein
MTLMALTHRNRIAAWVRDRLLIAMVFVVAAAVWIAASAWTLNMLGNMVADTVTAPRAREAMAAAKQPQKGTAVVLLPNSKQPKAE